MPGISHTAETALRVAGAATTGADRALPEIASTPASLTGTSAVDDVRTAVALLRKQPSELATSDWDVLGRTLFDEVGATIPGPRTAFKAPDFRSVVDSLRLGNTDPLPHADRYFNAFKATTIGDDAIRTEAHRLLSKGADELTQDEWKQLGSLLDADPTGEITGVDPIVPLHESMRQRILYQAFSVTYGIEELRADMFAWSRVNDPNYASRFTAAVDAYLDDSHTYQQLRHIHFESDRLEELSTTLPHLTPAELRKIVLEMSGWRHNALYQWMSKHDPEYETLVTKAANAVAAGTSTEEERGLLYRTADRIAEFTANRPYAEQERLARTLLAGDDLQIWLREHDPTWTTRLHEAIDTVARGDGLTWHRDMLKHGDEAVQEYLSTRSYDEQLAFQRNNLGQYSSKFIEWMRINSPDWEADIAAAAQDIAAGSSTWESAAILRTAPERLNEFIEGRPWVEQERIAKTLVDQTQWGNWIRDNDPEIRAKARAAIDRIVRNEPPAEGDSLIYFDEMKRVDEYTKGHPPDVQERIVRTVYSESSTKYAQWLKDHRSDYDALFSEAIKHVGEGNYKLFEKAILFIERDSLEPLIKEMPTPNQIRIMEAVNGTYRSTRIWNERLGERFMRELHAIADVSATRELTDDERLMISSAYDALPELIKDKPYIAKLRLAESIMRGEMFANWKAKNDPNRVEHIVEAVREIGSGVITPHSKRVLRGEKDVLGYIKDMSYDQAAPVAKYVLDDWAYTTWSRANDPGYHASLDAAIEALGAGSTNADDVKLLLEDRANAFIRLARQPRDVQSAVVARLLGSSLMHNDELALARDLAVGLRDRLGALTSTTMPELRDETAELIDRNINRMMRNPLGDPEHNKGYSIYPDYGELGTAQSNLELLEALSGGMTTQNSAAEMARW